MMEKKENKEEESSKNMKNGKTSKKSTTIRNSGPTGRHALIFVWTKKCAPINF